MHAVLRAIGWVYPLSPKLTTIGQSSCDIVINNTTVDQQHAVIEKDDQQGILVLRDLGSNKSEDQKKQTKLSEVNDIPPWMHSGGTEVTQTPNDRLRASIQVSSVSPTNVGRGGSGDKKTESGTPQLEQFQEEKDRLIKRMQEELNRLSPLEAIGLQKDILIRHLQQQLAQLSFNRTLQDNATLSPNTRTTQGTARPMTSPKSPTQANRNSVRASLPEEDSTLSRNNQRGGRPLSASPKSPLAESLEGSRTGTPPSPRDQVQDQSLIDKLKKERQILSGLVTQLQRDLSNKDANVGRMDRDMTDLRRQLDEKDSALTAVHLKSSKSQANAERLKENEAHEQEVAALRQKYKASQIRCEAVNMDLERSKSEVSNLHRQCEQAHANENDSRKKIEELNLTVNGMERSHRKSLLDKEEAVSQYARLRNRIMRAICSVDPTNSPDLSASSAIGQLQALQDKTDETAFGDASVQDTSNNALIEAVDDTYLLERLQDMVEQLTQLKRQLVSEGKRKEEMQEQDRSLEIELHVFLDSLLENQQNLMDTTGLRASSRLRSQLEILNTHSTPSIPVRKLREFLMENLRQQIDDSQKVEDGFKEAVTTLAVACPDYPASLAQRLDNMVESFQRLAQIGSIIATERQQIRHQLADMEKNHATEILHVRDSVRADMKRRIDDALNVNNEDHEDKLRRTINEVVQLENERHEQMVAVKQAIIEELESKLRETRQLLAERQANYDAELSELREKCLDVDEQREQVQAEQTALETMRVEFEEFRQTAQQLQSDAESACEQRWRDEVESHREQVKQHARTICVMEERLVKLNKQTKEAKAEAQRLKRQNSELQSEHKVLQSKFSDVQQRLNTVKKQSTPSSADTGKQSNSPESAQNSTYSSEALRTEIFGLKGLLLDRDATVESLRSDLRGTRAQLSDLRGELTETQKEEIESALEFGKKASSELSSARARLSQANDMLVGLRSQIAEKEEALKISTARVNEMRESLDHQELAVTRLTSSLADERDKHSNELNRIECSNKLTEELAAIGSECRGERHVDIIEKQRDALSQLRRRLRDHPNAGDLADPQEHGSQLTSLRREVAELRSQNLMSEVLPSFRALPSNGAPEAVGSLADEGYTTGGQGDLEKSGMRNAVDALHTSEAGYLALVRSIAEQLELSGLPGQRSLVYIPSMERDVVKRERQRCAETLSQRITVLREQVHRKEQLLSNYERDLGKLRQAESLAETKTDQLEQFLAKIQSKENEIQLLRQALERTRDELTTEKRLCSALKKHGGSVVPIHLTNGARSTERGNKPHCPIEDPTGKDQKKKQESKERMKKKNYEIRVLKDELTKRDQKLNRANSRLVQMSTAVEGGVTPNAGLEAPPTLNPKLPIQLRPQPIELTEPATTSAPESTPASTQIQDLASKSQQQPPDTTVSPQHNSQDTDPLALLPSSTQLQLHPSTPRVQQAHRQPTPECVSGIHIRLSEN